MLDVLTALVSDPFSDPDAVTLFLLLVFCFAVLWLFGDLLAPLLVALVMAYLLEWPVSRPATHRALPHPGHQSGAAAVHHGDHHDAAGAHPHAGEPGRQPGQGGPSMLAHAQDYVRTLPEKIPEIIDVSLVETIIDNIRQRILTGASSW